MSVYTMGGPNSGYEKDFNKRISGLNKQIKEQTDNITLILKEALTAPKKSNVYWNNVRRELDIEYRKMFRIYERWAAVNFPAVYRQSLAEINKQINQMANVTAQANKTVAEIMRTNASKAIVNNLYQDALSSWGSALTAGKANLYRFTRLTQQSLIEEALIDTAVAQAIDSGDLRNFHNILAGKSAQYSKLLEAVENERYVQAGGRKYKPEYYSELVSRVKFHEAQSASALAQANNYNTDLVVVSSHNTTTAICQEFEGKIFSISGKDKRFPLLTEVSPYHPNCLHLIFPQFESALIASGTLEDFSKFSKDKTDKPPYPSNFKPVSEREGVA